jgi:hypothetical protein
MASDVQRGSGHEALQRQAGTIDWKRAVLAGVAGTVVFDIVGLLATGHWNVPMLLGAKLGIGIVGGAVAHYANGAILAVIYAGIAPSLWGPDWARALTFITVQTVFGVWLFMNPLLDMGIAGLKAGVMAPVVSLIRHWAFGLTVAFLYPVANAGKTTRTAASTTLSTRLR